MDYKTFFSRFGGSYRTRNVNFPLDTEFQKTRKNKRVYHIASKPELPEEFIRLDPWEGEYLFMLAARARLGALEIGRYNGGSIFLMSCANVSVPLFSIDIAPQNDALLNDCFSRFGVGANVSLIIGDSHDMPPRIKQKLDLLFIDGDHSYGGCKRDLEDWFDFVVPGGHILLHDCYHESEVMDAVIDFAQANPIKYVNSPYIGREYWLNATGSMLHMIKLEK